MVYFFLVLPARDRILHAPSVLRGEGHNSTTAGALELTHQGSIKREGIQELT